MKAFFRKLTYLLPALAFLTLLSCAAGIQGNISSNGSSSVNIKMSLEPAMTVLLQKMAAAGGQTGQILNAAEMAASFSGAPGVSSVTFGNTSSTSVSGELKISKIGDFLTAPNSGGFIVFDQEKAGGKCVININRKDGPKILKLLSAEISDYLNALMAPIATGEEMTKSEYLELVASFYSKPVSDEIASSMIRASVDFPGAITGVKGGTFSGKKASFNISLLDLFVLETPLVYEVTWK